MNIENSLETVKGSVSGVASSPLGRVFLIGGAALVGLAVLRRSQAGAKGGSVVSGPGVTFATGGGGSGLSSSSPAPVSTQLTPDQQLDFMLKQGEVQAKIQGLINAQNLEQQKGLIALSVDQAKAQTQAALEKLKAETAFWNTPVDIIQSVARTGDTTATGVLSLTPFQLQQQQQAASFAQTLSQQTAIYNAQANAQAQAAKAGQPNPWRLENVAKTIIGFAGIGRAVSPPSSVNVNALPNPVPSMSPAVQNFAPAPGASLSSTYPSGVIPV